MSERMMMFDPSLRPRLPRILEAIREMPDRRDTIESGARRAQRLSYRRDVEMGIEPTIPDRSLVIACLGVELRGSGDMTPPTTAEVDRALALVK